MTPKNEGYGFPWLEGRSVWPNYNISRTSRYRLQTRETITAGNIFTNLDFPEIRGFRFLSYLF